MPSTALIHAGKSLLIPAILAILAGCDNAAEPVAEETPAAKAVVANPVTAASASAASADPVPARNAAPVAAARTEAAAPARAPAPAVGKAASPPVATRPAPAPTPTADPHAGHDMSTMSEEDMKKMGHN